MALAWGLALVGCAPLTPSVPFHLMETTELLPRAKFSLGFAGGIGGLAQEGWGSGGTLRLRMGTGARQEVGLEGGVLYTQAHDRPPGDAPPWTRPAATFGARLSWKAVPLPWLGVLAGAGASTGPTGAAAGGDLGILCSSGRPLLGWLRPYAAVRGFLALPAGRALDQAGGVTVGLVLPVGVSIKVTRSVRLFFEGGGIGAWSSLGADPATAAPGPSIFVRTYEPAQHGGFYGALGASFVLERNADSDWYIRSLRDFR